MLFKEDTPQPIIFSKENPESETDKGETKNGFSKKEKEISPQNIKLKGIEDEEEEEDSQENLSEKKKGLQTA